MYLRVIRTSAKQEKLPNKIHAKIAGYSPKIPYTLRNPLHKIILIKTFPGPQNSFAA